MAIDYMEMLGTLSEQFNELRHKRTQIEVDLTKLGQLIKATVNMLPLDVRKEIEPTIDGMLEDEKLGLSDAVKIALKSQATWKTPVEIRDFLNEIGFDFSQYTANPLTSIATTLKRMVPDDAEVKTEDGQIAYRANPSPPLWTRLSSMKLANLSSLMPATYRILDANKNDPPPSTRRPMRKFKPS